MAKTGEAVAAVIITLSNPMKETLWVVAPVNVRVVSEAEAVNENPNVSQVFAPETTKV